MGYYTFHQLTVYDENKAPLSDCPDEILDTIAELSGYENGPFEESNKWYDCDEDMTEVSRRYPNYYFEVNGDGEDSGDIWTMVWKAGKVVGSWRPDVDPPTLEQMLKEYSEKQVNTTNA